MYVTAMVIPVPEERKEAYRRWAENSARLFMDYGCLEVVESWGDFVPKGKRTDFFRAVDAQEGEAIVVNWQIWPDRESFWAAEKRMHDDPRLEPTGEIPFDPTRLINGCFEPIHVAGRE